MHVQESHAGNAGKVFAQDATAGEQQRGGSECLHGLRQRLILEIARHDALHALCLPFIATGAQHPQEHRFLLGVDLAHFLHDPEKSPGCPALIWRGQ